MQEALAWIVEAQEEHEELVELVPRHMLQGPKPAVQYVGFWLTTNLENMLVTVKYLMTRI